jgi:threonyl-tRNA synthetase
MTSRAPLAPYHTHENPQPIEPGKVYEYDIDMWQTGLTVQPGSKLRVEVDARNERMNGKIRDAQMKKVPYMLVVGDREAEAQAAAVRVRGGTDLGAMPVTAIVEKLRGERDSKALVPGVFRSS